MLQLKKYFSKNLCELKDIVDKVLISEGVYQERFDIYVSCECYYLMRKARYIIPSFNSSSRFDIICVSVLQNFA